MKNLPKLILYTLGGLLFFLASARGVFASAANEQKAENNPQVVSYFDSGDHTIIEPDKTIEYGQQGTDLVMQAGRSGNIQQWYEDADGEKVHSVWRNVGSDTECPANWLFVENPYQPPTGDTWGYYFPNNENYCVMSN